ncbi:hypothetical protein Tco_1432730 [Tanacetum coccineum]
MSKIEATKSMPSSKEVAESLTGHSKKKKKYSSAKDSNSSQPLASTPMVAGMHKEDLQATSGPASLRVTSTNPSVLVDKTQSAEDGLEIVQTKTGTEKEANNVENEVTFNKDEFNTSPDLSSSDDVVKEIKMEDLCKLVKDV